MKKTPKKEYQIPAKIEALFIKSQSAERCRDSCICLLFGAKKAIWYGAKAIALNAEAWNNVYELYPELKDVALTYTPLSRKVTVKDAK